MKRAMILFAKGFPYNVSEPFLETEYPLYKKYFDRVVIVTGCRKGEKPTREVNDPIIEIIKDYTLSKDVFCILQTVPLMITDVMLFREIAGLIKTNRFTWNRFRQMIITSLCGNHRAWLAKKWIKQHPEYHVDVIYSYWLQITAYAAVRLKHNAKVTEAFAISRTHGFDLYEERMKTNYLPFQKQIIMQLNEIASISLDGKRYLERKYGTGYNITIRHLGAQDRKITNPSVSRNPLRIVSCSRAVPIKRIDKIVEVLKTMTDIKIEWTHIGGGELLNNIKALAKELPQNITVKFTGTVANKKVYDLYSSMPFHVFVNVSKSEGVPVSIMEAMSFSIPVIATAVGGTAELVDDGQNGFLLNENFALEEFRKYLYCFYEMQEKSYSEFRFKARKKFKAEYEAQLNYALFVKELAERGRKYL